MNKRRRFKSKQRRAYRGWLAFRESRIRGLERRGFQCVRDEHVSGLTTRQAFERRGRS